MRSLSIILGLAVSLFISPAKAAESVSYRIVVIVTSVDLCSHRKGFTVDYSQIRKIREAYEDDRNFQKGYRRDRHLFVGDGVSGLTGCDNVIDQFATLNLLIEKGALMPNAPVYDDPTTASRLYPDEDILSRAKQGVAEAQYTLGRNYQDGIGRRKDIFEARRWYMRAAENGHLQAQYMIGMFYEKGLAVPS